MKSFFLVAILSLYAQLSFAVLPGTDDIPVSRQGSVGDAHVLLRKIAALAPLSQLNNGQYEEFQSAVKKLGRADGEIYVRELEDFIPQAAAVDPALAKVKGVLKQSEITVTYRTPPVRSPGRHFTDGKTNLFLERWVELKGRVIHGECPDLFVCDPVYQFYVDSVKVTVFRGYQGGGYTSAGGGG
jgi:hypothetical protein